MAYRKYSPRNWTQELMLRKKPASKGKKLKDFKKKYDEIESKFKSKIIDDLANFYYKTN